jgi:predicted ATP-dependent endonuclease of OLD family
MNCLIGPGDSTKTTVLDAIELCLNCPPLFGPGTKKPSVLGADKVREHWRISILLMIRYKVPPLAP